MNPLRQLWPVVLVRLFDLQPGLSDDRIDCFRRALVPARSMFGAEDGAAIALAGTRA